MRTLAERLRDVPQRGRLAWIGVRPERGAPMRELTTAEALAGFGLRGDRIAAGRGGSSRQVTLIQAEHLPVLAALTGRDVTPPLLRRNLVVAGINLVALAKLRFAIGDEVILVGTGACAPCEKMEEALGAGGFQAMRGHGGITARIERGGTLRVGDVVRVLGEDAP